MVFPDSRWSWFTSVWRRSAVQWGPLQRDERARSFSRVALASSLQNRNEPYAPERPSKEATRSKPCLQMTSVDRVPSLTRRCYLKTRCDVCTNQQVQPCLLSITGLAVNR